MSALAPRAPLRNSRPMTTTIDSREAALFDSIAHEWWDPAGSSAPLHKVNRTRLQYIRERALAHFGRDGRERRWLAGLEVLDIGCGGGILSEPLARLGGSVTGIDAAGEAVAVARRHAMAGGLAIDYRQASVERLAGEGRRFDLVTAMEVLEHVADVPLFLGGVRDLLKPGGLFIFSTPNRTPQSYAVLIVAGERLLRFIPRGAHDWSRFITPAELAVMMSAAGLETRETRGISFRPSRGFELSDDRSIDYIGAAVPVAAGG
jgi:2-polyprenyl-6-hydroxyphenyl methylase / 3-demethylubiquinone-9 3-methyltransferase